MAAVPAAVPDREAAVLEELGAEGLRREIADVRVPEQDGGGEGEAEGDRR